MDFKAVSVLWVTVLHFLPSRLCDPNAQSNCWFAQYLCFHVEVCLSCICNMHFAPLSFPFLSFSQYRFPRLSHLAKGVVGKRISVWSLTEMTIPVCERVAVVKLQLRSEATLLLTAFNSLFVSEFTVCIEQSFALFPKRARCPCPQSLFLTATALRALHGCCVGHWITRLMPWGWHRKVSLCLCFRDAQPVPWIEMYQQRQPLGYRNPELSLCDVTWRWTRARKYRIQLPPDR